MLRGLFACLFLGAIGNAASIVTEGDDSRELSFPEPLTADIFNDEMLSNLHVVEFFSPYCGHCRNFAPTWKKAWEEFYEEGQALNISLCQVDCVQSADLCANERIASYPSIRLYGPDGFLKDFPKDLERTKENLISFAREEAKDSNNLSALQLKSQSQMLEAQSLIELLGGRGQVPHLISFWPSSELSDIDNHKIKFENCEDCFTFQRTWAVLSNRLKKEGFVTSHFNCEANPKICMQLGFDDLTKITNHRADRHPKVALILPEKSTNNFFIYRGVSQTVKDFTDFALRTYSNSKVVEISEATIQEKTSRPIDISPSSRNKHLKTYIVFNYDPATVVPEDFDILEHLIEPLADIPDTYLFKSTDDLMKLTRSNYEGLFSMINYDESEPAKTINEDYFTMSTLTQYPTFFMFKEGSLIPNVFHGYSTTEMRSLDYIMAWILQDSMPFLNELTPSTLDSLIHFSSDLYNTMAVQLIDTSTILEEKKSVTYLKNFIVGAYDYESIRDNYICETILSKRNDKDEAVKSLKEKQASSVDIVQKMREEIPHSYGHRVLLAYMDLSKHESLLIREGYNIHNRQYRNGDVIVVDKSSGKFYYDRDHLGFYLTTTESPSSLKEVLSRLNLPDLYGGVKMSKNLIGSPYGKMLRFLDIIHQYGPFGYIILLALLLSIFRAPKFMRKQRLKRKYHAKRDHRGILGKENLKD
ncbi:LAFE_0G10924g1_1 [Lachancea fermentati]|uniref:LAFE_0G10924g1_1 n=1 Tax=Lachancea fermentati TaxID=4955 RepID=A0A1G4MHR7_LACFM|nr:LAFE_0G10924g1_1 [Lachancea fermentati]